MYITGVVNNPPPFNVAGRILDIFGLRGHPNKGGGVISSPPGFAQDVRFCISGLSKVFIFDRFYKVFRHGGMPCGL